MSAEEAVRRPGGFWVRLFASLIDGTLIYLASFAFVFVALGLMYWTNALRAGDAAPEFSRAFSGSFIQLIFIIVSTPVWIAYYTVATARYGTTVGKWPFKLRVINAADGSRPGWGQSALRTLGYMISYLPFGAGYLMALFGKERIALHDLMANTRVVKGEARRPSATPAAAVLAVALLAIPSDEAVAGKPIPQVGIHGIALDQSRSGGHVYGTRIEFATKWTPIESRGLTIGPRIGADLILGPDTGRGHALSVGGESALWLMNAIGMGLGVEYALALENVTGPHSWWVLEPFLRIRTERLGFGGAFVLHASPVYESAFGFGWRVGLVVEFSGVFGF